MKHIEPQLVWSIFEEITTIPRPSKKEDKIKRWLLEFASRQGLEAQQDRAGNIVIRKPSSAGYEAHPAVVLQAHMDMVCEKNNDVQFDFESQPIQSFVEGDFVKARGTTLGADNGIGMAYALSVLAGNNLKHPPVECLFTVDEETGLTGAFGLENNMLTASRLINLDSEDDGIVFIGCAGGVDTVAGLALEYVPSQAGFFAFVLEVRGLLGGHSGDDINRGRANANRVLAGFVNRLNAITELHLHSIDGGNLRNAIPREAKALVSVPWKDKELVRIELNHYIAEIEKQYPQEPGLYFGLDSDELPEIAFSAEIKQQILHAILHCPNGVVAMSQSMPDLVETSTNLASVKMEANQLVVTTSQRSSDENAKNAIAAEVKRTFAEAGFEVKQGDGYPGWNPNVQSDLLQKSVDAYQQLTGEKPQIRAIHAGLECGLFLQNYPHLDMISIGPQMYGVHSPDERLSISSTQKTWEWLMQLLARL